MQTRVVGQLGELAPDWDALVDRMPLPSPFLRSWWLEHVSSGEPLFVMVFDGAELLGGAALQRSSRSGTEWLQLLGSGPLEPDHLDLVAPVGRVADVQIAVREWLGRQGSRVVDLAGVRPGGWLIDAVPGFGSVTPLEVAPFATLPATSAEYLGSRPGRMRSTITRTAKRLAKSGVTLRIAAAADIDTSLSTLAALHDGRWGEASGFLDHWEQFAAAARAGAAVGEFVMHELVDASGIVIATEADFVLGGRTSFYQAGRLTDHEWRGSGSALRYDVIAAAIERGDREFDLLRGGESYKTDWADGRRGLVRIRRGIGPRGAAIVAAAGANQRMQRWRADRKADTDESSVVAGDS